MKRRMARIPVGRVASIGAALVLAVGGLAALPAVPANAASQVVSWWNEGGAAEEATFFCDNPQISTFPSGDYALEVYNPCGYRVWLHYYSGGKVYAYCVNPKGGLAYHFPYKFTDIQVTTNTSLCDAGNMFYIAWGQNGQEAFDQILPCQPYHIPYTITGYYVVVVGDTRGYNPGLGVSFNGCNYRIWLHQHDDGTGKAECINLNQISSVNYTAVYWQVQQTYNQAPCNAGGPPYPY